jgi:hypothetical protein
VIFSFKLTVQKTKDKDLPQKAAPSGLEYLHLLPNNTQAADL